MKKLEKKRKVQVVTIALNDGSPSLLLLKTNNKRGEFWQNVTGGVDEGEKFKSAAFRELYEETGYKAKELHKLELTLHFQSQWGHKAKEKCYLNICEVEIPIKIDPKEHSEYKWIPVRDVVEKDFKFISNYACFLMAKELI